MPFVILKTFITSTSGRKSHLVFDVNILVNSVVYGGLISLLALGLTLTYITLKLPNFAHGDLASIGTYSSAAIVMVNGLPIPLGAYVTLPASFLIGGVVALLSYLLVFRPLSNRGASITALMIASLALAIVMRGLMYVVTDVFQLYLRVDLFNLFWKPQDVVVWGMPSIFLGATILTASLVILLFLLMKKTKVGTAMRAAIENPSLALSLGIDVEKMYAVAWFLAGGLAAIAGSLLPLMFFVASPDIGYSLLLSIFAASVLGGLGSIGGAVVGGYVIGFSEEMGTYILTQTIGFPPNLRAAIPFVIIIVTLLFAPQGLTGLNVRKK